MDTFTVQKNDSVDWLYAAVSWVLDVVTISYSTSYDTLDGEQLFPLHKQH